MKNPDPVPVSVPIPIPIPVPTTQHIMAPGHVTDGSCGPFSWIRAIQFGLAKIQLKECTQCFDSNTIFQFFFQSSARVSMDASLKRGLIALWCVCIANGCAQSANNELQTENCNSVRKSWFRCSICYFISFCNCKIPIYQIKEGKLC